jgi:hypothetical protein
VFIKRGDKKCKSAQKLAGRVVGTAVCACQERHLMWTCNHCGDTTIGPALGINCAVLNGPAAVR